ncbi:MAG: hypothetical protein IPI67_18150 [Myxococcales bacterium]|nr:hypothetical protein [Myxococcales bacterium]
MTTKLTAPGIGRSLFNGRAGRKGRPSGEIADARRPERIARAFVAARVPLNVEKQ